MKNLAIVIVMFSLNVFAQRVPEQAVIQKDLDEILAQSHLSDVSIQFEKQDLSSKENQVQILCDKNDIRLVINSVNEEWSSTFYFGLQKLGFLFPHPRMQVSPTKEQMFKQCGQTFTWRPRLKYRGFHLHNMHGGEWMHGFLMGKKNIARDIIRWSVRNGQNVIQILLLKQELIDLKIKIADLTAEAQKYGLMVGLSVSFSLQQQKSFRLVSQDSKLGLIFDSKRKQRQELVENIQELCQMIPFDFLTAEIGTSEFTSVDFNETINWMNIASAELKKFNKFLMIKVHASVNQVDSKLGNFNFLPQYTSPDVGILPHTVFFYGLQDSFTPVYGRKNFADMTKFMSDQAKKRPTWYHPETSYYIALDIDVPLFLTDYLWSRSEDLDLCVREKVSGHLNFTTGQELGYWLFDWTLALLVNSENSGNPYVGLELLGEEKSVWQPILEWQRHYFKEENLISEITSENLMDELPVFANHVLSRVPLKDLRNDKKLITERLKVFHEAIANIPSFDRVKNRELKLMLQVTALRLIHSAHLREALNEEYESSEWKLHLDEAKSVRETAQKIMDEVKIKFNRYPEAKIFEKNENLSSYPFGYGWPAVSLHFWNREERMIRENNYNPFFMNIYDPIRILF